MNTQTIDGKIFAQMLLGGTALLAEHASELNDLNVFPVADGDTGTNMSKTMEGGLELIASGQEEPSIGEVSNLFSRGTLLSARGNSGVILSQIFAGINEKLSSLSTVNATELAEAYRNGIVKAYASVQNPTEGTILTVFRESTEYAAEQIDSDSTVEDFYRNLTEQAQRSLVNTREILDVLAEAGVVDSGAAGYLYIAEGMLEALDGKVREHIALPGTSAPAVDIDLFTRDSVLEFGYCTEFLLRLMTAKVDPDGFELDRVLSVLEELGGESVVAYKQDDIIKVHVHTFDPGAVLSRMRDFGEFLTVKIENMSLGHTGTSSRREKSEKKYAVVAVASGDGMSALFTQLGADRIIRGGPGANPSTEDFFEAFRSCGSKNIIVLPNHKNIIMAAKQAAELYDSADVRVVESKSFMQGYSALSVITPGITDIDALVESAQRATQSVTDCEITRAVRDAEVDGITIRSGSYIAISRGKIAAAAESAEDAVMQILAKSDADMCELITVFAGKDVSEERRAELTERINEEYDDCELTVYEGGQDVYDYYIALE